MAGKTEALVFEASRSAYSIGDIVDGAITVGELRALLEDYDDETPLVLSHDNGYTYGSLSKWDGRLMTQIEDEDGYTRWEEA